MKSVRPLELKVQFDSQDGVAEYRAWLNMPVTQKYLQYAFAIAKSQPMGRAVDQALYLLGWREGQDALEDALIYMDHHFPARGSQSHSSSPAADYGAEQILKDTSKQTPKETK